MQSFLRGNCVFAMSFFAGKITRGDLSRNLIISFIGNFYRCIDYSFLDISSPRSGQPNNHLLGAKIVIAANDKVNMEFGVAFARGCAL